MDDILNEISNKSFVVLPFDILVTKCCVRGDVLFEKVAYSMIWFLKRNVMEAFGLL